MPANLQEHCCNQKNVISMKVFSHYYRIIQKNIKRFQIVTQPFYRKRSKWTCPIIHIRKLTKLPPVISLPLLCGRSKGKLTCPDNLTILLIHNYKREPIIEKSLRYVGIDNFVVMRPDFKGPWFHAIKMLELKKFLDSNACKTEYLLFSDSDDAVLRDDPAKAIQFLQEENCDLLFSNTNWDGAYDGMPDVRKWADKNARESGRTHCYLNSGVYIGRTEFLREVVNSVVEYITDNNLTMVEYWDLCDNVISYERLPEFPRGVGSCQVILRYLHPRFYPRMKIDYKDRLAIR